MKLRTVYLLVFGAIFLVVLLVMISSFSNIAKLVSRDVELSSQPTIIIDAGHGGEDGGAEVDGVLEKDINLSIARKTADILRLCGYSVKEVRDKDISVYSDNAETLREKKVSDLQNRVSLFNENDNNIVVSIHQNKFENSKYHGAQIFYSKNDPGSADLAKSIQTSVVMLLQNDNTRELKPVGKGIYTMEHTEVPAVIVECGFLSNPDELQKLKDPAYQQEMAYAIAMGVIDYQNQRNSK